MQGTKNLNWYPKQISKGKYRDKKEICAGIFRAGDQTVIKIKHEMQTKKKQTSPKISKKNTKGRLSKQV